MQVPGALSEVLTVYMPLKVMFLQVSMVNWSLLKLVNCVVLKRNVPLAKLIFVQMLDGHCTNVPLSVKSAVGSGSLKVIPVRVMSAVVLRKGCVVLLRNALLVVMLSVLVETV